MADGSLGSVGTASVQITGDMTSLTRDLEALPMTLGDRIAKAERKIRAQMAANRTQLKPLGDDSSYRTVDDQKKYDALTASQAMLGAKLSAVETAYKRMTAAKIVDTSASDRASGATVRYAQSLRAVHGGIEQTGKAGGNAAYGLLRLSQAVEDAQYGFSAIVNNIPGIIMSFGGSAGLAGAFSIAAVAVNQLANNWSKLTSDVDPTTLMGQAAISLRHHWEDLKKSFAETSPIGVAMRSIEEFTNSLKQAAQHEIDLKRIREEHQQATEEVHGIKDKGASERGEGIREAVVAAGGGEKVLDMFMKKLADTGVAYDQKAKTYVRGQYSKLISSAMKGEGASIVELMKEAKGTALGPKIDEFSPDAKQRRILSDRETQAAEEQTRINRAKAEEENQRLNAEADRARNAVGSRLNVDLLTSGVDRGALKDILTMRLEDAGTHKGEAAEIADRAVEAAANKLREALQERVVSGQAGSLEDARKQMLKEENLKVGHEMDAQKAKLKNELGQNHKASVMTVGSYLERLQTGGTQQDAGVKAAQEANVKLDKIVENTKHLAKLGAARYGKRGT